MTLQSARTPCVALWESTAKVLVRHHVRNLPRGLHHVRKQQIGAGSLQNRKARNSQDINFQKQTGKAAQPKHYAQSPPLSDLGEVAHKAHVHSPPLSDPSVADPWEKKKRVKANQILMLKNLNTNLTRQDFARTVSEGTPCYQQVIPSRDRRTLQRDGDYYLIFQDADSVRQYRSGLKKLWKQVYKYDQKQESKQLVSGEISKEAQSLPPQNVRQFTLLPTGALVNSHVFLSLLQNVDKMIQRGGYDLIMDRDDPSAAKVLLHVTGVKLELKDIVQALLSDSIRRNRAWEVNLEKKSDGSYRIKNLEEEATKGRHTKHHADIANQFLDGQRWMIEFRTEESAQRFARAWHGQPFMIHNQTEYGWELSESPRKILGSMRNMTKMYTEVLW